MFDKIKAKLKKHYREAMHREAPTPGRGHSDAYHRHFEDWSEYETLTESGRVKIVRVYTGTWYRQKLSAGRRTRLRIVLFLLWLVCAAAFGISAAQTLGGNIVWYTVIAQAASIVFIGRMLVALFDYLTIFGRDWTVSEYKNASRGLCTGAIWAAVSLAAAAALTLLWASLSDALGKAAVLCAFGFLAAAASAFVIWRIEKRVPYEEIENNTEVPNNAETID